MPRRLLLLVLVACGTPSAPVWTIDVDVEGVCSDGSASCTPLAYGPLCADSIQTEPTSLAILRYSTDGGSMIVLSSANASTNKLRGSWDGGPDVVLGLFNNSELYRLSDSDPADAGPRAFTYVADGVTVTETHRVVSFEQQPVELSSGECCSAADGLWPMLGALLLARRLRRRASRSA